MKRLLDINNPETALHFLMKEKERRTEYYWKSNNGIINIKDMDDTHLNNAIEKLQEYIDDKSLIDVSLLEY